MSRFISIKYGWFRVLRISWPLIIANSFWNLQVTIDRIFLGNYSTEALGATIAVMGIFWVPMALLHQTAGYSATFVAQYLGAKKSQRIGPSLWQAFYISVFGGLLLILMRWSTPWLFSQVGHSELLQGLEVKYFNALLFSCLPMALISSVSGFFSGLGQTRAVMWINGVGLLFNVLFDYLLIFGNAGFPALGVGGAGYATALSSYCAAGFAVYLVMSRSNEEKFAIRSGWKIDADLLRRYLRFGVPNGLQWALEGLAFTAFLIFIGRMPNGEAALSASSIAVTIMMLAILPTLGVGQGVSILVGQYLGDNRPIRAERATISGLQVSIFYQVVMAISFLLFPGFYTSWFANDQNPELWSQVAAMVANILIFISMFVVFDAVNLVCSFALKGAGDTRFVTMVALLLPWPLMVLPTWLLSVKPEGIYWSWASASLFIIVQSGVFMMRFRGGRWKSMRVI